MRGVVEIKILFDDKKTADDVIRAMKHEQEFKKRTNSKLIKEDNELKIIIESSNIAALRAAINSYLRDLQVFEDINEVM